MLTKIAEIGYRAVEPFDPTSEPQAFRDLIDELGLTVAATHAPVLGDKRGEVLDALGVIGTDTVIVPSTDPARWTTREEVAALAGEFGALAAEAADRGVRVGYHNHHFELASRIDGRPALEVFADALPARVILEVDTYWAAVGGVDVPDLLRRLGDRVRYLHVKDGPATLGDPQTAVGAGTLPVREILAANPAVEWHVVELDDCATDMLTAVAESYAWLHENAPA